MTKIISYLVSFCLFVKLQSAEADVSKLLFKIFSANKLIYNLYTDIDRIMISFILMTFIFIEILSKLKECHQYF